MMKHILLSILLISISIPWSRAQNIFEAARTGEIQRIKFLYALKADTVNSKNENGFTPLIIAVYRNQKEATGCLLELGAQIDANSPEGPALLAAVYKNNKELTEYLIQHKANVNLQNEEGMTALMFAVLNKNLNLVELLMHSDSKTTLKSKTGHTAYSYAQLYNFTEALEILSK